MFTSERLSEEISNKNVKYISGSLEKIADIVCGEIQPDDIVLTIGAGDITKLGQIIIEKVELYHSQLGSRIFSI